MERYITIVRDTLLKESTSGRFFTDDGAVRGFTLEPHAIDWTTDKKLRGHTAIPCGRYRVSLYYSPRQKEEVALLAGVPHFTMVEIHVGNFPKDTQGCILVGTERTIHETLGQVHVFWSRKVFTDLMIWIRKHIEKGDTIWLVVT